MTQPHDGLIFWGRALEWPAVPGVKAVAASVAGNARILPPEKQRHQEREFQGPRRTCSRALVQTDPQLDGFRRQFLEGGGRRLAHSRSV